MCLNSRLIRNRKYIGNKKNGGIAPVLDDKRKEFVPIGCGVCIECRKQKANGWKTRLYEEVKDSKEWSFITLTFSDKSIEELKDELYRKLVNLETGEIFDDRIDIAKETDDNKVCTLAMRRFLERWRKSEKKSVKHFFISEKGHNGTRRIHMHGIIKSKDKMLIDKKWGYGWIYFGDYVNEKTINYISKYITKVDTVNKDFVGKILCSAGIGAKYVDSYNFMLNKFDDLDTKEYYITRSGHKTCLPIYYRNKRYSEEEREYLWMQKLDKQERFVMGEKVSVKTIEELKAFYKLLEYYRVINIDMGYKNNKEWNINNYKKQIKDLGVPLTAFGSGS